MSLDNMTVVKLVTLVCVLLWAVVWSDPRFCALKKVYIRNSLKYPHLDSTLLEPVAVESLGVFGVHACAFFREVAHRVQYRVWSATVTDNHLGHRLRISMVVQRGNAVTVLGCISVDGRCGLISPVLGMRPAFNFYVNFVVAYLFC